jgi:non-canonical (house-cleaning) NTP pyrophosphatase
MASYPREFWQALHTGVEVAVAGPSDPQKLLGVRDGFLSFLAHRLSTPVPVIVVPQDQGAKGLGLPLSDEETAKLASERCSALQNRLHGQYPFFVASEGGLDAMDFGERHGLFIRYWTAVATPLGEALGAGSTVQLPGRIIDGLADNEVLAAVPGSRRQGGMLGSLTAGRETQRRAVAAGTFNALSTLFYGMLEEGPIPRLPLPDHL